MLNCLVLEFSIIDMMFGVVFVSVNGHLHFLYAYWNIRTWSQRLLRFFIAAEMLDGIAFLNHFGSCFVPFLLRQCYAL